MKNNRLYLTVGSFVVVGFAVIIGIWLWFSTSKRQVYDTYQVVFHEPVDGVTTNSIVKYNGVEVGKVFMIELDKDDPSSIIVRINVNQGLPITSTTYATIKGQGITGMSFINLGLEKNKKYTIVKPHNTEPYPVIPSKPSLLYSLSEQAQSVTGNIKDISSDIKQMLNESNLIHINKIVNNLDVLTAALAGQAGNIDKTMNQINEVLLNFNTNAKSMNGAILELTELSKSLKKNSDSLDNVLDTFQNNTLRSVNTVLLPNLNQTVTNMNRTSSQVDELMRTINQNPTVLIRGKAPAQPGPGE
jgi:phospholipid/cholesterol/gamma-HCH transport system substrate-binding protein